MNTSRAAVDWPLLERQVASLLDGETDTVANAANLVALLFHQLEDVNWVGVYFLRGDELVVGPFQGKPACVRIPLGRGVCGTTAETRESLVVGDVRLFEGHIPCDDASNAEIVVPIIQDGTLLGVLDLDSPIRGRFSDGDRRGLEAIADRYAAACAPAPAAGA